MRLDDRDDLYQDHVLAHYEDPFHRGHCPRATHAHEDDNPLCGDRVRIELEVDDAGQVQSAYFNGQGCCISQAAASMLCERCEGCHIDELRKFTAPEMLKLFGAPLTPNRQKCCLLGWRVIQSALYSPIPAGEQISDEQTTNEQASA